MGPERTVAVRWQSKTTEVTRAALLTCETTVAVQVTPTVVKYRTDLKFEILQGSVARLVVTLPAAQALTKLQGEGVRDWAVKPDGDHQTLTVEFIKPVEKAYALTLLSEQPVEKAAAVGAGAAAAAGGGGTGERFDHGGGGRCVGDARTDERVAAVERAGRGRWRRISFMRGRSRWRCGCSGWSRW